MMNNTILCIFSLLLVTSCSSSYKQYEEPSFLGKLFTGNKGGYRDYQINENQFYISYQGGDLDSYCSSNWIGVYEGYDSLYQFALKRGAEVTRQHGFTFFSILSKEEKEIVL